MPILQSEGFLRRIVRVMWGGGILPYEVSV